MSKSQLLWKYALRYLRPLLSPFLFYGFAAQSNCHRNYLKQETKPRIPTLRKLVPKQMPPPLTKCFRFRRIRWWRTRFPHRTRFLCQHCPAVTVKSGKALWNRSVRWNLISCGALQHSRKFLRNFSMLTRSAVAFPSPKACQHKGWIWIGTIRGVFWWTSRRR